MFVFPDASKCIEYALNAAGLHSKLWLAPEDFDGREIVHVQDAGGTEQSVFRTDRLIIDVYATGRSAAKDLAEAVKAALVGRPHSSPDGVIDKVTVDVTPSMEPFQSETVCKFNAIYRAESRPI